MNGAIQRGILTMLRRSACRRLIAGLYTPNPIPSCGDLVASWCAEATVEGGPKTSGQEEEEEAGFLTERSQRRAHALNWMHASCTGMHVDFDCLFLGRTLLDRVVASDYARRAWGGRDPTLEELHGLACACLLLACKSVLDLQNRPCPEAFAARWVEATCAREWDKMTELEQQDTVERLYRAERNCLIALSHDLGMTLPNERYLLAFLQCSAMSYLEENARGRRLGREIRARHPAFADACRADDEKLASVTVVFLSKFYSELALLDVELNPPRTSPLAAALACVFRALSVLGVSRQNWERRCPELGDFTAVVGRTKLQFCDRRLTRLRQWCVSPQNTRASDSTAASLFQKYGRAPYDTILLRETLFVE